MIALPKTRKDSKFPQNLRPISMKGKLFGKVSKNRPKDLQRKEFA
jgi:hypothetical protein